MSADARPQWASQRAMSWVIDEAPVPTALFPVLMVIARRCDERGRGSYQSVPTIASKTGKSVDQVKRDIRDLKKLGLLMPGDESLVAHIEVWSRPTVYDVPLHVIGPKPVKESRNKAGVKGQGGGMDAPPGMDAPGGMDGRGRGGMDAPGGGGMDAPLRKPLNNPLEKPSSLSEREAAIPEQRDPRDRERDELASLEEPKNERRGTAYSALALEGVTDEEADRFIAWANLTGHKGGGWYRTVADNGDLPGHIAAFREADTTDAPCPDCNDTGMRRVEWMENISETQCGCIWQKNPDEARRQFRQAAAQMKPCVDGVPGGDIEAPNGWRICPQCRGPGWVDKNIQGRTEDKGGSFKRSTAVLRAEQGLRVADELDRQFGHGQYASGGIRSPADQRVADNQALYEHYRQLEGERP